MSFGVSCLQVGVQFWRQGSVRVEDVRRDRESAQDYGHRSEVDVAYPPGAHVAGGLASYSTVTDADIAQVVAGAGGGVT